MAQSSFGGVIKLTGEDEYKRALRNISSNLKVVSSDLKLTSDEFVRNGKSVADLTKVNDSLKAKQSELKKSADILRVGINHYTESQEKNQKAINESKRNYEEAKNKLDELKHSTAATSSEIKNQEKVVKEAEQALYKQQKTYEANNGTINDFKVKLNNTTNAINDIDSQISKNIDTQEKAKKTTKGLNQSVDELEKQEKKTGKQTSIFGEVLKANLTGDLIKKSLTGMANAMKAVGRTIVNVAKESIKSYAEFEQLEGGVKTLFGTEASSVEEYAASVGKSVGEVEGKYNSLLAAQKQVFNDANNAYKTAGLSANEYMNTVTSFSASLISSLNGDTEAAAKAANQAIVDMSDNANKMGTSMESIQTAYQGFAKQNYTMLDNLKLGYGGTKQEMQRLLSNAEKLSGQKYDISNLNDVYQAIHVVQEELGITGTTAKEAEKTISGSLNATKSAWKNLLTGISSDNANFSELVKNFADSVVTVSKNLIPRITQALSGLGQLFVELVDTLLPEVIKMAEQIINGLIQGINTALPSILVSLNSLVTTVLNVLINNLPKILDMGIKLIVSLVQGISQSLPTLIPQMLNAVTTMVMSLLDNIDLIIDAGIQLIIGLADGLIVALPQLIDKIPEIIDKLIMAITNNLPKIIMAGVELTVKLAFGIIKAIPNLVKAIPKLIASFVTGIANYYYELIRSGINLVKKVKDGISQINLLDVGKNLVQGLWKGINNTTDWILKKIKGFGKKVLKGIKAFFGIHSPSTVFRDEIGENLAKGIGIGFESEMDNVNASIQKSLPTDFDLNSNVKVNSSMSSTGGSFSKYDFMVNAFKEALKNVKVVMNDREMGHFVEKTTENLIYG